MRRFWTGFVRNENILTLRALFSRRSSRALQLMPLLAGPARLIPADKPPFLALKDVFGIQHVMLYRGVLSYVSMGPCIFRRFTLSTQRGSLNCVGAVLDTGT